jgi:ubiquinone/menaquinone biosynthesis C-methylase UbiE/alpha-beta hydrolase superfamily lysophospholipase
MIADHHYVHTGQIRTEFVQFTNPAGLTLSACVDHAGDWRARPWVLIAPKYGETKKSNLQLAYHLVANGLNVLRFDHTNHVGESEGQALDFSLPGAVEDITACLDFLAETHAVRQVIMVANSLSARCALRAAADDDRIGKFISVAGVVNLFATMSEIYREDILSQYRAGRRWGVTNFLGLDVQGDVFLQSAISSGLFDLGGTITDAAKLRVPLVCLYAERDTWVRRAEVEQVLAVNPRARMILLPAALHEVRENPRAAEQLFREVIWSCLNDEPCPPDARDRLALPDKKLLLEQNRRERERMRRSEMPAESEKDFWSGYLKKYSILERSSDYQAYLQLLARLCRPLPAGAAVLDAGCGNGMFGHWVLREAARPAARTTLAEPLVYVGLDLTQRGLHDAMAGHLDLRPPVAREPMPGVQYSMIDFDLLENGGLAGQLPFADGTFDLICCSLVLSYLKRPEALLRELYRVLKPGGGLVASSMKPHCDLSAIYHDSLAQRVTATEIEAGRDLLRAAGKIKLKEEIGHYAFFSRTELAGLVIDAGFCVHESQQSFGDQAVVVKAVK